MMNAAITHVAINAVKSSNNTEKAVVETSATPSLLRRVGRVIWKVLEEHGRARARHAIKHGSYI